MRRSRAIGVLLSSLLALAAVGPAFAADAVAGIYQLTTVNVEDPGQETETQFLTVVVKEGQVILLVNTPGLGGPWYVGLAEVSNGRLQGSLLDSDFSDEPVGPFDLLVTPESVTGTLSLLFGPSAVVSSSRIF